MATLPGLPVDGDEPAEPKNPIAPGDACCDPPELPEPDIPEATEVPPELAGNDPDTEPGAGPPDASESERAEEYKPAIEAEEAAILDELDELDEDEELLDELELNKGGPSGPPPPPPPPPPGQQGQPA